MKTKYMNLDLELSDSKELYCLEVRVREKENEIQDIHLELTRMAKFFQKEIMQMAKKEWPGRKVSISFTQNVDLHWHSLREFRDRYIFNDEAL